MIQLFKTLAATSILLFASAAAQAQDLQTGIDAWLADDDETALPIFSQLAQAGDRDARLLLGQIEAVTPPGASSSFVNTLPRADRIALLRSAGGLSGTSWTRVLENEGDTLATALMAARLPDAGLDTAKIIADAGEIQAANRLAWEIFDRGRWSEVFALSADDPLMAELDFVQWMRAYFANPPLGSSFRWLGETPAEGRSGGMMMISLVAPVLAPHLKPDLQLRQYSIALRGAPAELIDKGHLDRATTVLDGQMSTDSNLATVQAYCDSVCPEARGYCAMQVIAQVGGADNLKMQDTPLESLIAQEDYATSPRAVNQLRRWMASIGAGSLASSDVISKCVTADIAAAQATQ